MRYIIKLLYNFEYCKFKIIFMCKICKFMIFQGSLFLKFIIRFISYYKYISENTINVSWLRIRSVDMIKYIY